MARPTKYNKAILDKANKYLTAWKDEGDMIPSVEGLSEYINIARSTIYDWEKQEGKEEFSYILEKINVRQKRTLINGGLNGELNSNITKLVLGKHGLSDKQEMTGKDGKDLIPDVIQTIYD